MLRYRLDELGAFQFEWLAQSLLKIAIGPGVESWGGHGDYGRDAFCSGPLNFPDRAVSSAGPFVFQAKFVENANAAGASPTGALKAAIEKERSRIHKRAESAAAREISHYILLTNAPLTPLLREWGSSYIGKVLKNTQCHFLGGSDICDFLDQQPSLRQAFPQLLGLRDLTDLIQGALNRENVERSTSVLDCANEIAPVFVPTLAYNRAWRVLTEHHFVVLEGPPEMGKSAIAWMIALAQVWNGWQAIYCTDPDAFFAQHDPSRAQIFVADDAFGLTEYDPIRSQKWEHELGLVTRKLDSKHWLAWTSRKHILERALQKLDFRRHSPAFPDPNAVVVNAADLTQSEKALIFYRHAKRAGLPMSLRKIIRKNARRVVDDPCFTPERIRKLVTEVLPSYRLTGRASQGVLRKLQKDIREAIRNPTERIKTSFRALPPSHKWLLISMLEHTEPDAVAEAYAQHCPKEIADSFDSIIDQLTEGFIRRTSERIGKLNYETLGWIHPSYRDLVIEELCQSAALSEQFLRSASLAGISLAVSTAGGEKGDRELPLLTDGHRWKVFAERCRELCDSVDIADLTNLLSVLAGALRQGRTVKGVDLGSIIAHACLSAKRRWDASQSALSSWQLKVYIEASLLIEPLPAMPNLQHSWTCAVRSFAKELRWSKKHSFFWPSSSEDFFNFAKLILKAEPRFLKQVAFPRAYSRHFEQVFDLLELEAEEEIQEETPDDLESEIFRLETQIELAQSVCHAAKSLKTRARKVIPKIEEKIGTAESMLDEAREIEAVQSYEGEDPSPVQKEASFSIDSLFADL